VDLGLVFEVDFGVFLFCFMDFDRIVIFGVLVAGVVGATGLGSGRACALLTDVLRGILLSATSFIDL